MASINLWEIMGHTLTQKTEPIYNELALKGRYGQELSIEPTEEGWLIKIFSCFDDRELRIHVLQDGGVEIS